MKDQDLARIHDACQLLEISLRLEALDLLDRVAAHRQALRLREQEQGWKIWLQGIEPEAWIDSLPIEPLPKPKLQPVQPLLERAKVPTLNLGSESDRP